MILFLGAGGMPSRLLALLIAGPEEGWTLTIAAVMISRAWRIDQRLRSMLTFDAAE